MSYSNEFETRTLQWAFTNASPTRPTAWYVALFTTTPAEDASGTEVSGTGYARKAVTFTVTGNTATNSGAVEFDQAEADWGTVTHVGVFDASTSGNMIAYSALDASKVIADGDVFRIPAGDLDVTAD